MQRGEIIFRRSFLLYQIPLYVCIVGIFVLSSIPSRSLPDVETEIPIDKAFHFVEYGVFGFLLSRVLLFSRRLSTKLLPVLVIGCAAVLGAVDESYQSFTGRNTDIHDWIFDCLGAATASLCYLVYISRLKKQNRKI